MLCIEQKTELESTTLREETAEELAMVVSPQPRRPTPSLNVEHVPSIEVVTPWSLAEESLSPMGSPWASQGLSPTSDNCDETPLLHVSTPTSDAGITCVQYTSVPDKSKGRH